MSGNLTSKGFSKSCSCWRSPSPPTPPSREPCNKYPFRGLAAARAACPARGPLLAAGWLPPPLPLLPLPGSLRPSSVRPPGRRGPPAAAAAPARRLAHAALVPPFRSAAAPAGFRPAGGWGSWPPPGIATCEPAARHVPARRWPAEGVESGAAGCRRGPPTDAPAHTMRGGGGGQSAACAAEIGGLSGVELARGLNRLGVVGPGVSARPLPGRAGNQEVRGLRPLTPGLLVPTPVASSLPPKWDFLFKSLAQDGLLSYQVFTEFAGPITTDLEAERLKRRSKTSTLCTFCSALNCGQMESSCCIQ